MLTRLIFLCLSLTFGSAALGQQLDEWRPNIAEDNKAATWDDTALFISNTLTKYSQGIKIDARSAELVSVSPAKQCVLKVAAQTSTLEKSACKPLQSSAEGILGISLSPISSELSARIGKDGYVIDAFLPGSPAASAGIALGSVLVSVELMRKYTSKLIWFNLRSPEDLQLMIRSDVWDTTRKIKLVFKDKANRYKTRFVEVEFDGTCQARKVLDEQCLIDLAKVDPLSVHLTRSLLTLSGTNNESFGSCVKQGVSEPSGATINQVFGIQFADTDFGKRAGRALLHASILCGGTKAVSPF